MTAQDGLMLLYGALADIRYALWMLNAGVAATAIAVFSHALITRKTKARK